MLAIALTGTALLVVYVCLPFRGGGGAGDPLHIDGVERFALPGVMLAVAAAVASLPTAVGACILAGALARRSGFDRPGALPCRSCAHPFDSIGGGRCGALAAAALLLRRVVIPRLDKFDVRWRGSAAALALACSTATAGGILAAIGPAGTDGPVNEELARLGNPPAPVVVVHTGDVRELLGTRGSMSG